MNYRKEGNDYTLSFSKDELIMLIALLHEGLESIRNKLESGNELATLKYDGAKNFVDEVNLQIMRS